ncbi:hypothetical protein PCYB_092310 [Plasmodium cynomolgi strain B]|uniref:Transporter n=1 Tax=Plasmodium cynomolgi (strain B) TaxID=1120755 RepID=K6UVU5_PLACD|nr:hypothetical protein PCYB_092310 [Plasmodium cynomolgi strain B]GAB66445.1 hypothetical protein PCYB_092310 [Plasmodium cynomolgi strain B]
MQNPTYFETKERNSQSIYLYSNILSLIYCSSLVTYIFILIFDLAKKNYVVNSFYIVNLVSHFIIFLLLSDIQMRNTDLRVVTSGVDTTMSRVTMPLVERLSPGSYSDTERTTSPNDMLQKKREINFYFKRNLQDRLSSGEFLSVGLFQRSAAEFILGGGLTGIGEGGGSRDGDNQDKEKRNSDSDEEPPYTYERKCLKFLYLFIVISSICSGYIKIYQKRIMYCIFYVNIGVITSLLILMNSLFKLFAHSLNYVVTNNNSDMDVSGKNASGMDASGMDVSDTAVSTTDINSTEISDYIILFLVIDMFGLLMILIFTYKWFYQKKLWVNLHSIFYNYEYVCFYHKETYYLYSVDKDIDNILVHIDMCRDDNIRISFSAYMSLNKSIFYDYLRVNRFRKNKLRILEIEDETLEVKSTYKVMDPPGERSTPSGDRGDRGERGERGEVGQRGERGQPDQRGEVIQLGEADQRGEVSQRGTPSFSRKKNHSYTMKPYKICIESLSSLANLGPNEEGEEEEDLRESAIPKNGLAAGQLEANQFAANQFAATQFAATQFAANQLSNEKSQGHLEMNAARREVGNVQTERSGKIPSCVKKQGRRLAKGDSVHFLDQPEGEAACADAQVHTHLSHDQSTPKGADEADDVDEVDEADGADEADDVEGGKLCREESVDPQEREEQRRNVLLIPNYDEECNRNVDYYDEWELSDDGGDSGASFLSRADERNGQVKSGQVKSGHVKSGHVKSDQMKIKILDIYQGIKNFCSSFTFYFFFFIFIYAFLLSIMHIFINYFFYIYLFVFNINIYVSNIYTIIMTFVSLIAIPFSGYIVDNIGSFLSLLLCSSSFILVAISGSIYCYKFNLSISESIIPTVIISQIPTHMCVKNNENITSAFAFFELVTMIIISVNNYIFGCFLIKEEYLKGLYVLFFFVILVIILILLLILTIYLKKKRSARAYKSPRNADLVQPLL